MCCLFPFFPTVFASVCVPWQRTVLPACAASLGTCAACASDVLCVQGSCRCAFLAPHGHFSFPLGRFAVLWVALRVPSAGHSAGWPGAVEGPVSHERKMHRSTRQHFHDDAEPSPLDSQSNLAGRLRWLRLAQLGESCLIWRTVRLDRPGLDGSQAFAILMSSASLGGGAHPFHVSQPQAAQFQPAQHMNLTTELGKAVASLAKYVEARIGSGF